MKPADAPEILKIPIGINASGTPRETDSKGAIDVPADRPRHHRHVLRGRSDGDDAFKSSPTICRHGRIGHLDLEGGFKKRFGGVQRCSSASPGGTEGVEARASRRAARVATPSLGKT
jgi:hypothetical protein